MKKNMITVLGAALVIAVVALIAAVGLHMGGVIKLPFLSAPSDVDMTKENAMIGTVEEGTTAVSTDAVVTTEEVVDTIAVTVPTVPSLKEIVFAEKAYTVFLGEELVLDPMFLPEDAVVSEFQEWFSEDESIATVQKGVVTPVAGGTTKITLVLDGCIGFCEVQVVIPLTGLAFEKEMITAKPGQMVKQEVQLLPENTTERPSLLWTSDREDVATVNEAGEVTPLAMGETTITASYGDLSASYVVKVEVPIETASLSEQAINMVRGGKKQLIVGYAPTVTSDDTTITWTSSDPNVVSVEHGILQAKNIGYAIIYAQIASFELSCEVSVSAPIERIAINYPELGLKMGAQAALAVGIFPADTTDDTTVLWASSDPKVAVVDPNGVVTAVGVGQAEIVAKVGNQMIASKISVVVPLESIAFDRYTINLQKGQTDRLEVSFYPANTTSAKKIQWNISDASVLGVTPDGLITAVGGGSAIVGATVDGITLNCVVNVAAPLESIAIAGGNFTAEAGRQKQLSVIYNPKDTTVDRTVLWASENPAIARVDANGLVTAVSQGTTAIVANVAGVLTSCQVTVTPRVEGPQVTLVFDPGHGGVFVGSAATHYGVTYYERDQNLKVALYTRDYLLSHYEGVTIHMTRTTDTQISTNVDEDLRARCALGAQVGADAVVSFHFNGVASHTGFGATILCTSDPRFRAVSDAMGNYVLQQLSALGIHNRGLVHKLNDAGYDYYAINRYSAMNGLPSILIEHCFMDNINEWKFFGSDEAMQRLAAADAIGIASYYGLKAK